MKTLIENAIQDYLKRFEPNILQKAMAYALLAGGKRLRPELMLRVLECYHIDPTPFVSLSIALEMVHTYSLIHDDLPAMDNDDLRRGKPSLHKAFDEGIAILAGDALLTDAFKVITSHELLTPQQKVSMIEALSFFAGSEGMILGQVLDLESEQKEITLHHLIDMYTFKTSYLFNAALQFGATIASPEETKAWLNLGTNLGIVFQLQDDILEHTSSVDTLGKSKTDELRNKPTIVSLLGLDEAKNYLHGYEVKLKQAMEQIPHLNTHFVALIESILKRKF
jgi:geranylgeranyl diphosphate synthase, type II